MNDFLFVEKYRPQTIQECILPTTHKNMFQEIVDGGADAFPNMTLSGDAGTGKTTVARALCNELSMDYLLINASEENGIDVLRTKIKRFATTKSLSGNKKVVILDEADNLSSATMQALRGFIESYSKNCRFILTCNYKNKIIPALHSRCPVIDFKIPKDQRGGIAGEMFLRMSQILKNENIQFNDNTLERVVVKYFPDFRTTIGKIQQFSKSGTLQDGIVGESDDADFDELFSFLKGKKFVSIRKWVSQNSDMDIQSFYSSMYKYLWKRFDADDLPITNQSMTSFIPMIQEYSYQAAFTVDNEINMMAFLTMTMVDLEYV